MIDRIEIFVTALSARVQRIFVVEHLRTLLLDEASKHEADQVERERFAGGRDVVFHERRLADLLVGRHGKPLQHGREIGRASCRERV